MYIAFTLSNNFLPSLVATLNSLLWELNWEAESNCLGSCERHIVSYFTADDARRKDLSMMIYEFLKNINTLCSKYWFYLQIFLFSSWKAHCRIELPYLNYVRLVMWLTLANEMLVQMPCITFVFSYEEPVFPSSSPSD
jgi:hypothetical protein